MKTKSSITRENILIGLIILASAILFWMPFIGEGVPAGAEMDFHYARIGTLAESLKEGIFPAKLRPMHMKMYGYGVGFFYPDIFIYPMAVLIALGVDAAITIKSFLLIFIICGAYTSYLCFYRATGNKGVALIGEILFIGSRINYDNLIGGAGLPHLVAYLFIPLAVLGLLEALQDEKQGYIKYGVGITIVLLSHHLIFLTLMIVLLLLVIVNADRIAGNVRILGKLFCISLVAMALTTAYWLPAMEQAYHIRFIALYDNSYDITEHLMPFNELFMTHVGPILFVVFILAVLCVGFLAIKRVKIKREIISILIVNIVIIYITCSRAIWLGEIGKVLNFFQYPERFVFILTNLMVIFIVLVMGEVCSGLKGYERSGDGKLIKTGLCIAGMILLFVTRFDNNPNFYDLNSYSRKTLNPENYQSAYHVSGAEWLPVECEPSECKTPNTSMADDGSGADGFKHDNAKYYEVWVNLERKYYDVPYVYYYGYRAYLVDENMNQIEELKVGEAFDDNGYVRVFMPESGNGFGHLLVTYRKTKVQLISYAISLLMAVGIAVYCIAMGLKKKHS